MLTRTINLCGIDDETWKKFRIKCIKKEISMSRTIIQLIKKFLEEE